MSCSSLKHRYEQLRGQGSIPFLDAVTLYSDLKGSLDAHDLEMQELQKSSDRTGMQHLQSHISEGRELLRELESLEVH